MDAFEGIGGRTVAQASVIAPIGSRAPHDLLWLAGRSALTEPDALPEWASDEWLAAAPVVVRREDTGDAATIPVGLRGRSRAERHAAYLPASRVLRRTTPESLAGSRAWARVDQWSRIPAIAALAAAAPTLDAFSQRWGVSWGITGSVGFALATGIPILRADSDLDLLLRSPRRIARGDAAELDALLRDCHAHIDVQVDTGAGGFALAECAAGRPRVLLKTGRGPRLVADPWVVESND